MATVRWHASLGILTLIAASSLGPLALRATAGPERAERVAKTVRPRLERELTKEGFTWGAPVFLRIFKKEAVLELFIRRADRYALFRSYPICAYSGELGPKTREGDNQSPEGFYSVSTGRLNPASAYHLAMNLGYPNAYDRAHNRTGDFLMVHGNCVSVGCFAMTDAGIEEIYTLTSAALAQGQVAVPVHAFPFRFTRGWQERVRRNDKVANWLPFWINLEAGYRAFERTRVPPSVTTVDKEYRFSSVQ